MSDFEGRVVLVTGARGNLGAAVAAELSARGARLVCADAAPLEAASSSDTLALGGLDLSQVSVAQQLVAAGLERFGRIDALVNTIGGFRMAEVGEGALADWDFLFTLNARIALVLSAAVIPAMAQRKYGRIVHVAAGAGQRAGAGIGVYSAAKASVLRIAEAIAEEQRDNGIACNCIMPSTIDTPQNRAAMPDEDHSRWVTPQAIARVAAFLASADAGAVTGVAIPVVRRD